MRDFTGVIVFFSIMCLRNFTRVKKNVICLGLLPCFRSVIFDEIFLELRTFHLWFVIA